MIATVTLNPSLDEWMALPSLTVGALNRARAFQRYPAGKGVNVSRVVHELGGATIAYALAGGDDGIMLRRLLTQEGVRCEFVPVRGTVRNNYKIQTQRPRALTEINTEGPRVTSPALRALLGRLLKRHARCVVFSGSVPPGVPSRIYQRWIRMLRRAGAVTVLDASGAALRYGLSAGPWLIKPNRQEAEDALRRRVRDIHQAVKAAVQLSTAGPSLVILSLGAGGAVLAAARPRVVWIAQPPRVAADSSVGAGDSLVGGFLTGWASGQPIEEAFRLGVACGTATAMTPGTALCRRADVHRFLRRVKLRRAE